MTVRIDGTNSTANPAITGADTDTGLQLGTDEIQFVTGGTNRATVESNGNLTIEDGNLVLAQNHGINFHPQGGSDVNLLDDYEEGTFTPFIVSDTATDASQSIVSSYSIQNGFYTKIGDTVVAQIYLQTNTSGWSWVNGGASAQNCRIGGLPFDLKSVTNHYPAANFGYFATWNSWSAGYTPMGYGIIGDDKIAMVFPVANGVQYIQTTHIYAAASQIICSITYKTAT